MGSASAIGRGSFRLQVVTFLRKFNRNCNACSAIFSLPIADTLLVPCERSERAGYANRGTRFFFLPLPIADALPIPCERSERIRENHRTGAPLFLPLPCERSERIREGGWGVRFLLLLLLSGCSRSPEPAPSLPANVQPAVTTAPKTEDTAADTFESALTLTGTVQSGAKATLTARQPAKIVFVGVKSGDTVTRGQVLVRLDEAEAVAQEQTANAGIVAAQAQVQKANAGRDAQRTKADSDIAAAEAGQTQAALKLAQAQSGLDAAKNQDAADQKAAREGIRKAEIALNRAKEQVRGLEKLATVGGVARNDLDGARAQLEIAQSDYDTAKAQASQGRNAAGISFRVVNAEQDAAAAKAGTTQAGASVMTARRAKTDILRVANQDIAAAKAAVLQAKAGLGAARAARAAFLLMSPIRGAASEVSARVGETAQPGVPLVTVVSLTGLHAEALATARQLSRIHLGQTAQISADTQIGTPLSATVSEIARSAEPDGRTFRVQFRFASQANLRPGQTVRLVLR